MNTTFSYPKAMFKIFPQCVESFKPVFYLRLFLSGVFFDGFGKVKVSKLLSRFHIMSADIFEIVFAAKEFVDKNGLSDSTTTADITNSDLLESKHLANSSHSHCRAINLLSIDDHLSCPEKS